MRACFICEVEKPLEDFAKSTQRKSGRGSYCKPCDNERKKKWRETQDQTKLKEWQNKYSKKWKKENSDKNKLYERKSDLKKNYGITLEQYEEILNSQNGVCSICKRNPMQIENGRNFPVDHDHKTGKIRGILCGPCNRGLGQLGDSIDRLESAILYLKENS